jgi:3',5'-cyclic AMP phosphodiesterase CpdA
MLIAQMTDTHIGFEPEAKPEELNRMRFRATLDRLIHGPNRPDLLILSGDITDKGDRESFEKTAELLSGCPFPVWPMVGNHDLREEMLFAFPQVRAGDDGFVHYVLEGEGGGSKLRILCLDTLEPGRHGGAFCEARQAWLSAQLAEAPDTPTVIFMHHPPVVAGIDWMDPAPDEPWILRFASALDGHDQVLAVHCGHLHRPLATRFRGIPLSVTPSVAPLVAMDLRPVDPGRPDNRDLITTEPPSYALHRWDGQNLVSHFEKVSDFMVLASYTDKLQPMIREMLAEKQVG